MEIDPKIETQLPDYGEWHFLGKGSLGQTWRVRKLDGTGFAVVKIRPMTEAARRAVEREADLMRRLKHPGLQRFIGQQTVEDQLILIYHYIEGPSLKEELQTNGAFPVDIALQIMVRVLQALQVIHDAGFIHRDISPQNLILQRGRFPVLIDFNAIGHLTEDSNLGRTTMVGEYAGKPLYMTPEQLFGMQQGASVDIWAIGAVLYEMVTGRTYRKADTLGALVKGSLSAVGPNVQDAPEKLHGLLARFLSQDPAARPNATEALAEIEALLPQANSNDPFVASIDEFGPLLERNLGGKPPSSPPAVKQHDDFGDDFYIPPSPPEPPPTKSPSPYPREKSARKASGIWWKLALVILIGALAAGLAMYRVGRMDASDPTDPPAPYVPFWSKLSGLDYTPIAFLAAGLCLIGLGIFAARWLRQHASKLRVGLPLQAVQLISGPDARDRLSETICFQIDAYHEAAGQGPDQMLTLTMVALAKEYADADNADQRLKALQMLHDLHGKVAGRLKPWWLDYETLMARGLSLSSLAAGSLVVIEGLQRLF
ncbi:serine/threonine protein kinase [Litoreibacter halocynthiae]|uniref:Serine/threonine protein kinase n=2 Tax=Litoreibacter halocynthiae TaxID=1242689 RepID=A0A4R7LQ02_9RHOB|nr:serine/threonine protein kinase [Litoreibacter halocynthiae]